MPFVATTKRKRKIIFAALFSDQPPYHSDLNFDIFPTTGPVLNISKEATFL